MSDKKLPQKQVTKKTAIQFIKEGKYSLHPAFGPIIDVKIGDVDFFAKDVAQQIIDDEWGVEAGIEPEEPVDDEDEGDVDLQDLPFPEKILRDVNAGQVTDEIAKGLLGEFALEQLGIPTDQFDKRKSVKNLVDDLLIELEIQEENND